MKTVLTIFMLTLFYSFNCDVFDPSISNLSELNETAHLVVDQTLKDEAFAAAKAFLDKNKDRTDFEVAPAEAIIAKLTTLSNLRSESGPVRSQACLYMSGIHGRISDKLRANGGTAHGKKALSNLKLAISYDGKNKNAGIGYATTIQRMIKKSMITRKFIEGGMGIDLEDETKNAAKVLESMNLTSHATYKDLKDF